MTNSTAQPSLPQAPSTPTGTASEVDLRPVPDADRRHHERVPAMLQVHVKSATQTEFSPASCMDVSCGGVFLKSEKPLRLGTLVKLKPGNAVPIDGVGRVVWARTSEHSSIDEPPGMGIKFVKLSTRSKQELEQFVAAAPRTPTAEGRDRAHAASSGIRWRSVQLPEDVEGQSEPGAAQAQPLAQAEPDESAAQALQPVQPAVAEPSAVVESTMAETAPADDDVASGAPCAADVEPVTQSTAPAVETEDEPPNAGTSRRWRTLTPFSARAVLHGLTLRAGHAAVNDAVPAADDSTAPEQHAASSLPQNAPAQHHEDESPGAARTPVTEPAAAATAQPASRAAQQPRPISRQRVAAATLGAVAALGAMAWVAWPEAPSARTAAPVQVIKAPEPQLAPPAPPPAAPATVAVPVITHPAGAEVFVDGASQGSSPVDLLLPPDTPVTVSARAAGLEVSVEVTPGKSDGPVELQLAPLQHVLHVETDPPAGWVVVQGQHAKTPAEIVLQQWSGKRIGVTVGKYHHKRRLVYVSPEQFREQDGALRAQVKVPLKYDASAD